MVIYKYTKQSSLSEVVRNAAELDIPKETIGAALGHSDKSVTNIYINFNQKKVDDANRKVLDYIFQRSEYEKKEAD